MENTNMPISLSVFKSILKVNHDFNNVLIASKVHVIKASPKSDMAIVWLDIWDVLSSSKAGSLINRCFNIKSYITTIQNAKMNLNISQCKNCWK